MDLITVVEVVLPEAGDCYEAAAKLLYAHRSCPAIVLVHGPATQKTPDIHRRLA